MNETPRVPNDPQGGPSGALGELLRLQTEFQTRLAEETLRYLRRLQGAAAPAAPGTVLSPGETTEVTGSGLPGTPVELVLEVENRQRVHCVVTPMMTPLVEPSGAVWFPAAEPSPSSMLLAPDEVRTVAVVLSLPADLAPGTYRGALVLQGFRDGGIRVAVTAEAAKAPSRRRRSKGATTGKSR